MKLSDRLKKLRAEKGLYQKDVAAAANIDRTTYIKYEKGTSNPDSETLTAIANLFGVSVDYLVGKQTPSKQQPKGVKIPVFGRVAAGIPIDAIEDILDYEEITEDEVSKGEYFALKIKGNSMEPRIYNGDIVIVRRQNDVNNGDIAIVLDGDDATCKKIKKTPEGVFLQSLNPNYEAMYYSNKEIENRPILILGKVVECRSKFEKI